MNLFDAIFNETVARKTAICYEHEEISYEELRQRTLAAGRILTSFALKPGERVALLLDDSPEFVSFFVAICSSGAIAVPINMGLHLEEQIAILKDSDASVAIVEGHLCDALLSRTAGELENLKTVVSLTREHYASSTTASPSIAFHTFDELLQSSAALQPVAFRDTNANEPAFILYTSGSTGEPKGAVHTQSDIFYTNETYCREVLSLQEGDRLFSSSRLPFAYGLGNAFTFPLLNGHTSVLCRSKPTPEVIASVFRDYRPTIFFGVPVVYRLLIDFARKNPGALDCSSLRFCVSAGEALPAHLGEEWEAMFGIPALDGIGSTEMLHMWMSNHVGEVVYGSSGKVLHGYKARLLDPEGNATAPGKEGNLWVKGDSAALGYWNKAEVSAQTFVDGWVRTGDLYRQDDNGYWFHMGRSDDCFKSSGQWVSPVEVEGVLLRHKDVSRAAVVEDFDEDLPCACAFVVCAEGSGNSLERELRELADQSLPRFKRPRRYVFVNELPYTATGKIQRFKLREGLREHSNSMGQTPKSAKEDAS
jgi:benzoate-CoA ligase